MPSSPILVTGAAGRLGGTGRHIVADLVQRGLPVRAMVRRTDERSEALAGMGADVVVADFTDYASLVAALDGITSAYFCYPVGAGLTEAAGLFAAAGRDRGVARIVDLSLDAAFPESPSPQGRAQWVAESIFEWAGYDGTHLRVAAFFMANLIALYGRQIRESHSLRNSFGDFAAAWIASSDVAAVAAAVLADPDVAPERTTVIGGAERATHGAIAEILTRVTGRAIRYEALTPEQWRDELVVTAGASNPVAAAHQAAQSAQLQRHDTHLVTDDVRRLTGRSPVTLEGFLTENREWFVAT